MDLSGAREVSRARGQSTICSVRWDKHWPCRGDKSPNHFNCQSNRINWFELGNTAGDIDIPIPTCRGCSGIRGISICCGRRYYCNCHVMLDTSFKLNIYFGQSTSSQLLHTVQVAIDSIQLIGYFWNRIDWAWHSESTTSMHGHRDFRHDTIDSR